MLSSFGPSSKESALRREPAGKCWSTGSQPSGPPRKRERRRLLRLFPAGSRRLTRSSELKKSRA